MQDIYTYNTLTTFNSLGCNDIIVSRTIDEDKFSDESADLADENQRAFEEFFVFYNINPSMLKDLKKLHGYVKKPLHDGLVHESQSIDSKLLKALIKYSSGYEHIVFDFDSQAITYKSTRLKEDQKTKLEALADEFKLDSVMIVNLITMIFYGTTNEDVQEAIKGYLASAYYNDLEPFEKMSYGLELGQYIADETRYVRDYFDTHGCSPYDDTVVSKTPF